MTAQVFSSFVIGPLLGSLVTASIVLVSYLIALEIKEFRRNRRMDALRQRLGLRRA